MLPVGLSLTRRDGT